MKMAEKKNILKLIMLLKIFPEKEEFQRQGDEMAWKIAKCKTDLSSLKKSLEELKLGMISWKRL